MSRIALLVLVVSNLAMANEALDAAFDKDVLVINASRHACYRFDIWLAVTREQQRRGLMHVRNMPETSGMLFVNETEDMRSMWMKNTYIPLDIAFIRADGGIVNIERDTEPQSLRSIASTEPVHLVLELNAGVTERLSIDTDSSIIWSPVSDQ